MKFSVEKQTSITARALKTRRQKMIKEEKFHINDLIDYNEFLRLYEKYGNGLNKEEFARSFLDLKKQDLYILKNDRCRILKQENISEFEIANLKIELIRMFNLKKGEVVSYEKLEELYNSLQTKLPLIMFAEKILDIPAHFVSCIKSNQSKNTIILSKTDSIFFKREEISKLTRKVEEKISKDLSNIREIKECISVDRNLHIGDKISVNEFEEIYEIYGKSGFSKYDFARIILGLTDAKSRQIINKKIDFIEIWKNEIINPSYLLKIRNKVIHEKKLHIKDKLKSYDDFKKLFERYSAILSEEIFADEILDMSKTSYKNLKNGKSEAVILSDIVVPDEFWEKTKKKIKKKEDTYGGKRITYAEFLEIYKKYGYITLDSDFALNVLQISKNEFYALKRGEYLTVRIFTSKIENSNKKSKDEDYDTNELRELRNIIIKENKLHINDSISGEKFNELYDKYGFRMSKKFFANKMLDIKDYRLDEILRDKNKNTRILLDEDISKEYLGTIRKKVFTSGEHVTEDMIDYNEFLRLYRIYGEKLSERQFAENVLFISNDNLGEIREKGKKTKIFANINISDAYVANIKSRIVNKNLLYHNQKITPSFFRRLYKQIKTIFSEADFAREILEVSRQVYGKTCRREQSETFRILSVSGTYENKNKFQKWQNTTLKKLLDNGFSYTEIEETTNLTHKELLERVDDLYKSGIDVSNIKRKYISRRLRQKQEIEEDRKLLLNITDEDINVAKKAVAEEMKLKKMENKCKKITDEFIETQSSKEYLKKYVELCKEKYKEDCSQMSEDTLECLHTVLEFLEENNIEYIRFFIQACIEKNNFKRANEFITFTMQEPDLKVDMRKSLNKLRTYLRYAIKRKRAIDMVYLGKEIGEITHFTGLTEVEVIELSKKFQENPKDKVKN